MFMKKVLSLVLCLSIVLMLSSCVTININGKDATQPTIKNREIMDYTENIVEEDIDSEDDAEDDFQNDVEDDDVIVEEDDSVMSYSVTSMREENYTYTDKVGNTYDIDMRIPSINIDSNDAKAVNDEINNTYSELFDNLENSIATGTSTFIFGLDYDYWECEDILSVMITTKYDGGSINIKAYSFDLANGKHMNNDEIVEKLGMNKDDVLEQLRNCTDSAHREAFDFFEGEDDAMREMYNSALADSKSDSNLEQSQYLVQDDFLCSVVNMYTLAGSGQAQRVVRIYDLG